MANQLNRNVLHLLVRLMGLTGLVVAVAGLVLWTEFADTDRAEVGQIVTFVGAGLAGLALFVEIAGLFRMLFSRRGAVGGNVFVQVVLALTLLVGINIFSFFHYERFDWTLQQEFTLDAQLREELAKLTHETTLVVLQRHAPVGQQGRQDNYDSAADRKIVEKVRDLVDQFQELGPRFHVRYLDIDDALYEDRLRELKKLSPALVEAIEKTPENSIFFYTQTGPTDGKKVESIQRLGFADIYQLDREASQAANEKRGNLVLKYQGAGPFARKILNIEEKRPRIAVAAVFESDTMASPPPWGMSGVKKSLEAHGFDSRDIILKRQQFSVLTYDENKFERLEAQLGLFEEDIAELKEILKKLDPEKKDFQSAMDKIKELQKENKGIEEPLQKINQKYGLTRGLAPVRIDDRVVLVPKNLIRPRKDINPEAPVRDLTVKEIKEYLESIDELDFELTYSENRKKDLLRDKEKLNAEDLAEKRRLTDLKTKFDRMLADCDLILVPRLTLVDVSQRDNYPYNTYRLDNAQVQAIKAFVKAGKPALFCLSPPFDEKDAEGDGLDLMLADLGIRLGSDSVFYRADSEALAERRSDPESRSSPEPPQVEVDWSKGVGMLRDQAKFAQGTKHSLRTSLRLGTRVSAKQPFDLRLRHPRPVYVMRYPPEAAAVVVGLGGSGLWSQLVGVSQPSTRIDDSAVFLLSGADSWNEEKSFPLGNRIPRYRRLADDPNKGTLKEKRRGPFPIAVAVEKEIPASWFLDKDTPRPKVRLAVIGHGGVFLGGTLSPAQEKLLLDTCNYLLGRDDLLARDKETSQFPRVVLANSDVDKALWKWGAWLGLPLLFAYFGLIMLLVRRLR